MSTHSDEYLTIEDTIKNHDKNVIIHSIIDISREEASTAANRALHEFVHHHYMEHGLCEDEANELHLLVDREVPSV